MKNFNTKLLVSLMAAVVLVVGCKREYGTVILGARIDDGRDAKVYIDDLTPCWHNNDLIRVNNQTCTTSAALGSLAQITDVIESSHYSAIYPADIVGNVDISSGNSVAVTLPRVQLYEVDSRGDQKVKVPMGAYSSSESLTFYNLCSLIKVVISSQMSNEFMLERIKVSANIAYLSGQGTVDVTDGSSARVTVQSQAQHDVSLLFGLNRPTIATGDRNTYVYYIVVPEFPTSNDVTITLYADGNRYFSVTKYGATLGHNKMATISLTVDQLLPEASPEGTLQGLFSISATEQVRFSQGNLQYQASTSTWRFAENQYDCIGSANSNISATYSGWIDLFGWGTSGWNSGATAYMPYSTSRTASHYYPGGSYQNGLTGEYACADWGVYNAISNGGNEINLWRTLTRDEWEYIINTRNTSTVNGVANARYAKAQVNNKAGLILFPDNYTHPNGVTQPNGINNATTTYWTQNNYNISDWGLMETAGAVFLPAGEVRWNGTQVSNNGPEGAYWSSTPYTTWIGTEHLLENAYCLFFDDNDEGEGVAVSDIRQTYERFYGLSVRLVRNNN